MSLNPGLRFTICSQKPVTVECISKVICSERSPMAVVALKLKPKLKTFYATVHVTRAEEWCVEAESAEEARQLLASGVSHRCHPGDRLHLEVERVED